MSYPDVAGLQAHSRPTRPGARLASCLDELPGHRREYLVWRLALRWSREEIDARLADGRWDSCRWFRLGYAPSSDHVAALGSDGRYHLCLAGEPSCAAARLPNGAYAHEDRCGPDPSRAELDDYFHARWTVILTEHTADPALIAQRERCPVSYGADTRAVWPPYHDRHSRIGHVRIELSQAFGRDCHICHRWPGTQIDHDPLTGYVRGLLCANCNIQVCVCAHVSGCLFGDYLDDPPAMPLRILYPNLSSFLRSQESKIKRLGYDPFVELRARLGAARGRSRFPHDP
jgi:Recombination endonuclease VII